MSNSDREFWVWMAEAICVSVCVAAFVGCAFGLGIIDSLGIGLMAFLFQWVVEDVMEYFGKGVLS